MENHLKFSTYPQPFSIYGWGGTMSKLDNLVYHVAKTAPSRSNLMVGEEGG